jgi:tRNA G37 N-methylase Trm5
VHWHVHTKVLTTYFLRDVITQNTTVCVYTAVQISNVTAAPVSAIGKEAVKRPDLRQRNDLQRCRNDAPSVYIVCVQLCCVEFMFWLVCSIVVKSSGTYKTPPLDD